LLGRPEPGSGPLDAPRNLWRKEDDVWTIGFEGRQILLKDSNGLAYIAELLRHPARELHVADLRALVGSRGARGETGSAHVVERGAAPAVDRAAAAEYRRRLRELRSEIESAAAYADLGRAERARHEMEMLSSELAEAYGLGRARRDTAAMERVRKAVTNQIRRTLARLEDVHPALERHLRRAIQTGVLRLYTPDLPITWIL